MNAFLVVVAYCVLAAAAVAAVRCRVREHRRRREAAAAARVLRMTRVSHERCHLSRAELDWWWRISGELEPGMPEVPAPAPEGDL